MSNEKMWLAIAVIALVTAALRFLPFVVFSNGKKTPALVDKLGRLLPFAIMGMLVVYCLKDVSVSSPASFVPALVGCAVVGGIYVWRRNTLLSILLGTICYMLLVQLIF